MPHHIRPEVPHGWTSVVCPFCHCVLGLYARPRGLDGFGSIPSLVQEESDELIGIAAASG